MNAEMQRRERFRGIVRKHLAILGAPREAMKPSPATRRVAKYREQVARTGRPSAHLAEALRDLRREEA